MFNAQLAITGLYGLTGVALSAYGGHGLTGKVPADRQQAFLTGSHYQIVHSAAMLGMLCLARLLDNKSSPSSSSSSTAAQAHVQRGFWLMAAGTTLFSGTIYWLVMGLPKAVGPLTPIGGLLMMGGWGSLIMAANAL